MAALAILGQRSAHSFPIGPVIAEPMEEEHINIIRKRTFDRHAMKCTMQSFKGEELASKNLKAKSVVIQTMAFELKVKLKFRLKKWTEYLSFHPWDSQ